MKHAFGCAKTEPGATGVFVCDCGLDARRGMKPVGFNHLGEVMHTDATCGIVREVLIDPETGRIKSFVCGLPKKHEGRYGRNEIIEHRQGNFCWHEIVLSKDELDGLVALQSMSDRAGVPGIAKDLVDPAVLLTKLRASNYASDATGVWLITPYGREVVRLRSAITKSKESR